MDSNLVHGTSIMSNISVDSKLGDFTYTPMNAESHVYYAPGEGKKTEYFAFLDIFQGVTNDIRGLQATLSELSSKNEKLLPESYDLKLENMRLESNSMNGSSRDTPCEECMPRGMVSETRIKQRELSKETTDFNKNP